MGRPVFVPIASTDAIKNLAGRVRLIQQAKESQGVAVAVRKRAGKGLNDFVKFRERRLVKALVELHIQKMKKKEKKKGKKKKEKKKGKKKKEKKKGEAQVVSEKVRSDYEAKLLKWVDSRLTKWDESGAFRTSKMKKLGIETRAEYAEYLNKKVAEKMKLVRVEGDGE